MTTPTKLPESTSDINWLTFAKLLINRDNNSRLITAVAVLMGAAIGYTQSGAIITAPVLGVVGGLLVAVLYLKSTLVRPVFVLTRYGVDVPFLDSQEWWCTDERMWPDSWRWRMKGKRVLFVNNLSGTPERMDPWAGPMPAGNGTASPTDLLQAQLEAGAIKDTLMVEKTMSDTVRTGLLIAVIAGSFIAIMMAGDRLVVAMSQTPGV